MSHGQERKEKNCLNCGSLVQGRFCQVCGQENIEPKQTAWHLVNHFFEDITHFDGKFFHSVKYLFTRPGFLPKEYMAGRRASYLNPVRMYIFTSAIFFLLFFTFSKPDDDFINIVTTIKGKTTEQVEAMPADSFARFTANINKDNDKPAVAMTREEFRKYADSMQRGGITLGSGKYATKEEYEAALKSGAKKHNWFERQFKYKEIELNSKYNNDSKKIISALRSKLLHSIPQMLFVSLPLLALVLKLVYIRRRKQFYYMSHAIFSIYLYIFLFLGLLVLFGINKLNDWLHWGVINWIFGLLIVGLFFYEYKALRNFYQQGRGKTILKFLLINILFLFIVVILFVVFSFFSFFEI